MEICICHGCSQPSRSTVKARISVAGTTAAKLVEQEWVANADLCPECVKATKIFFTPDLSAFFPADEESEQKQAANRGRQSVA